MKKATVSAIIAIGKRTRAIGKNNDLIWKIPDDLKRFKTITSGHPIIMGRKTFESIGRPLPNRTNIIITRNPNLDVGRPSVVVVTDIKSALDKAHELDQEEIFIIGGGEIYKQALPFTDRLYLTLVDSDAQGDVFFPAYDEFTKVLEHEVREWNGLAYEWITLEK